MTTEPDPASAFFDLATRQRACRSFSGEPVGDGVVERILATAVRAPSAENAQPWVFVVVRDAATRGHIVGAMQTAWDAGAREYSAGRLAPALLRDVDRGVRTGIANAPVLVVVSADTTLAHPSATAASVFPAVQNLLLAATALGLGSTLTTLALQRSSAVRDVLGLPDHVEPMAVVPLGYPAEPLGASRRRPLTDVAHRERFGNPW